MQKTPQKSEHLTKSCGPHTMTFPAPPSVTIRWRHVVVHCPNLQGNTGDIRDLEGLLRGSNKSQVFAVKGKSS